MVSCPHCKQRCNPMGLILVTKWTPYKCPKCNGKSKFYSDSSSMLGGICGAGGYFLYSYLFSTFDHPSYINVSLFILTMGVSITLILSLFFTLKPD